MMKKKTADITLPKTKKKKKLFAHMNEENDICFAVSVFVSSMLLEMIYCVIQSLIIILLSRNFSHLTPVGHRSAYTIHTHTHKSQNRGRHTHTHIQTHCAWRDQNHEIDSHVNAHDEMPVENIFNEPPRQYKIGLVEWASN